MIKKMTTTNELAVIVSAAYNVSLFCRESSDTVRNAERNLAGKTHYVDADTRRYYHSRINAANVSESGLVFWIIESVAADSRNTSRGFRAVAFDLFGTVLSRVALDELATTSDKARKAYYVWLETFNVAAHYTGLMQRDAARAKEQAANLARVAKTIKF